MSYDGDCVGVEGGIARSQVFGDSGSQGCHIGYVLSILDFPPVLLRMCREVVWSRLYPLPAQSSGGRYQTYIPGG